MGPQGSQGLIKISPGGPGIKKKIGRKFEKFNILVIGYWYWLLVFGYWYLVIGICYWYLLLVFVIGICYWYLVIGIWYKSFFFIRKSFFL